MGMIARLDAIDALTIRMIFQVSMRTVMQHQESIALFIKNHDVCLPSIISSWTSIENYIIRLTSHARAIRLIQIMLFRENDAAVTSYKHTRLTPVALYNFIINHPALGINLESTNKLPAAVASRKFRPADFPLHHSLCSVHAEEQPSLMRINAAQISHTAILDALVRHLVVEHPANHGLEDAHAVRMGRNQRHFALGEDARA